MLEIEHLEVRYGHERAVADLSLAAHAGELITLVGPTGCGKTTTLQAVAGLTRPTSGTIRIGGRTVNGERFVPPERRQTGLVFQSFALFPHLTVAENVGFRLDPAEPVEPWLAWLEVAEQRDAYPEALSGGQKQRVALARALAHRPELILLDEPLSNLDASLKDSLRWEIRNILKEAGVPAIWVTHDQAEALSIGDRLGVMRDGVLEQIAEPDACFHEPATRFVAEFLGEASFLPARARGGHLETPLGRARSRHQEGEGEVLVRPDDLALVEDGTANGTVAWTRFEGGTRLFRVHLDCGPSVQLRTNHTLHHAPGERVRVAIDAGHALTLFPGSVGAPGMPEHPVAAAS